MKAQLNSSVPSMIFTEDLKTVIHCCEDIPEDIDMCIRMMKRLALTFLAIYFYLRNMSIFYLLIKGVHIPHK